MFNTQDLKRKLIFTSQFNGKILCIPKSVYRKGKKIGLKPYQINEVFKLIFTDSDNPCMCDILAL